MKYLLKNVCYMLVALSIFLVITGCEDPINSPIDKGEISHDSLSLFEYPLVMNILAANGYDTTLYGREIQDTSPYKKHYYSELILKLPAPGVTTLTLTDDLTSLHLDLSVRDTTTRIDSIAIYTDSTISLNSFELYNQNIHTLPDFSMIKTAIITLQDNGITSLLNNFNFEALNSFNIYEPTLLTVEDSVSDTLNRWCNKALYNYWPYTVSPQLKLPDSVQQVVRLVLADNGIVNPPSLEPYLFFLGEYHQYNEQQNPLQYYDQFFIVLPARNEIVLTDHINLLNRDSFYGIVVDTIGTPRVSEIRIETDSIIWLTKLAIEGQLLTTLPPSFEAMRINHLSLRNNLFTTIPAVVKLTLFPPFDSYGYGRKTLRDFRENPLNDTTKVDYYWEYSGRGI